MTDTAVKIQAARNAQSEADKVDVLQKIRDKTPRKRNVSVQIGEDQLDLVFQAISSRALDALQAKHTPTVEQRSNGMIFNIDTFAPALVAAVSYEPKLTEKDTTEMWKSDAWSTGELQYLFDQASQLCMEGLNIPFIETA